MAVILSGEDLEVHAFVTLDTARRHLEVGNACSGQALFYGALKRTIEREAQQPQKMNIRALPIVVCTNILPIIAKGVGCTFCRNVLAS